MKTVIHLYNRLFLILNNIIRLYFRGGTMLKKRELQDAQILYNLMTHPDIFPFVRHKANSYYEFLLIIFN